MKSVLRSIIGLLMLCAIAYLVYNYYGTAQSAVGVKGASTEKAQEITENVKSDLDKQADKAAESASQVTVGEIVGFFGRFQKIPEDVANARQYVEGQVNSLTNKEEK
jgi:hypothetical protein